MPSYVALIRGAAPAIVKTRNDSIAPVLEKIGLKNVRPILGSGNFVFTSNARSTRALEQKIEKAFLNELDLATAVLVRSQNQIGELIKSDPFAGLTHGKEWYLLVTFQKNKDQLLFTKLERAKMNGPDSMASLEKDNGKAITSRTWNTVLRIFAKMQENS